MNVIEKYISIEGEGLFQGYPTVFIRFAGCNLKCSYCDSLYSHNIKNSKNINIADILIYILKSKVKRVTLTGGEPLYQDNIYKLINILVYNKINVNIETNGSITINNVNEKAIITMDYKLPSSNMESFMNLNNLKLLKQNDVLKFVCKDENDLNTALNIINKYNLQCNIFFSPVFNCIQPKRIVEFILDNKLFNCRVQLQIHKYIWNPEMRGV